ncbi:MAG: hypothetical protein VX875_10340 [Pseudomonadota bacterium]|nr:hypothetical protein [Pseudomonadota bacterium]
MNDNTQQSTHQPHLLHSLILITLETIVTFLLKHDRASRIHAKRFVQHNVIICFKTFLPASDFYVTFDNKGILFDPDLTESNQVETFTVSASSIDLVRFLLTGNDRHLRRMRLFGGEEWHDQFRLFMHSLTLPMLFADWKNWWSKQQSSNLPQRSLEPLLSKLELQRSEISQLELQVKEQHNDIKSLERKLKNTHRMYLAIFILIAIVICAFIFSVNL